MSAGDRFVSLPELAGRLGGPGWLERSGFTVHENPTVPPGTVLYLAEGRLVVPSLAAFRAAFDWYELDLEVRATFNRMLRRLANRAGVTTPGIARGRSGRTGRTSDHAVGPAMDLGLVR